MGTIFSVCTYCVRRNKATKEESQKSYSSYKYIDFDNEDIFITKNENISRIMI